MNGQAGTPEPGVGMRPERVRGWGREASQRRDDEYTSGEQGQVQKNPRIQASNSK